MARVLIAGCGYVGTVLGERLAAESHRVFGLRRNPRMLPASIEPIEADLCDPALQTKLPTELDWIFYLASPSGSADPLYRRAYVEGLSQLLAALEERDSRPKRLLYASSTAVYGQTDGDWVDESSGTEPGHFSGKRLLEGEQVALGAAFPATLVRFGGIYGPRRTRMVDRVRAGRAVYREHPPLYSNRIHRDDCAGVLRHLAAEVERPASLYLAVDCEPTAQKTVFDWLAGVIGSPAPRPEGPGDPPASRSSNKRCRNDRLLQSGYTFRYPTFREGYRAVLEVSG